MKNITGVSLCLALSVGISLFGQQTGFDAGSAERMARYKANADKVHEAARAFMVIPHPDVEAAKEQARLVRSGLVPALVPTPINTTDVLIWTTNNLVLTGYSSDNNGLVTKIGIFSYQENANFNLVAPVGDAQNTVFVTADSFDGTILRLSDPGNTGTSTTYSAYDGPKNLNAFLALSLTKLVGNTVLGNKLLRFDVIGDTELYIPNSLALNYVGSGSVSLARNSRGDIASLDIRNGLVWILRNGKDSPEIFYSQNLQATAIAFDPAKPTDLYALVAGQQDPNNYIPSRIVKLADGYPNSQATLTEVVAGGLLNIEYGPNSIALSGSRIYFTNLTGNFQREILVWDQASGILGTKVPPALAQGVGSFALLNRGSAIITAGHP
jgi:hypothetical protein